MMEGVDIQSTDESVDTAQAQQDTPEAPQSESDATQSQAEKDAIRELGEGDMSALVALKINGEVKKMPLKEALRYAQINNSGYKALERAAEVEKKAKEAYQKLLDAAKSDPEGLIRILNPQWSLPAKATRTADAKQADGAEVEDLAQAEIRRLEQKLGSVEQVLEQQEIDKERKAIESELDAAVKSYPELDNKIYRDYVKSQYRRALQANMDVSMDDVAFHVAQEMKETRSKEEKERQRKLAEKRKLAPETTVPGAPAKTAKPMTLDDVKRLAGRLG